MGFNPRSPQATGSFIISFRNYAYLLKSPADHKLYNSFVIAIPIQCYSYSDTVSERMARSSSGPGRLSFKEEIMGSTPIRATFKENIIYER